jgi:hypothetical protein
MRIAQYCLSVAAAAALCGMSLGIAMAMRQDFTLAPAHAHLNLLGWVSMALYGLYYRGAAVIRPRLAWTQAAAGTLGFVLMFAGLAVLLTTGDPRAEAVITVGALAAVLAMALFLFQVLTEHRRRAGGTTPWASEVWSG